MVGRGCRPGRRRRAGCARPSTVCDENTHAIVRRVNSSFVTPFDREDIYSLACGLDDVMDELDEAVDLILLYEVEHAPGRGR